MCTGVNKRSHFYHVSVLKTCLVSFNREPIGWPWAKSASDSGDESCISTCTPASAEVEEVFEETDMSGNWGRFVAFIMWLKRRPRAFEWYVTLRRQHPETWTQGLCRLAVL